MADGGQLPCTPAEAAAEILRRRRARALLIDYTNAIEIPGAPISDDADEWLFKPIETSVALHHRVICQHLQECIEEDYGRLMIFAPPGSAKSSYASVVAPTWAMGKFPGLRVLMTSYAGTPIIRASKRARQIVASEKYANIWETETTLVQGSTSAAEWELTNGSGLFAAGLMGGITSSRCDLGIIDDPVAGREEAESETVRKKTLDAYYDDFLSRLKPKASIVIIQTRWHQDDLAGSILPEDYKGESGYIKCRDGQTWRVLSIPAECDSTDDPLGRSIGEFLWPEWFSSRHWMMYKAKARTWASLFQQQPTPADGIYFHRANFRRHRRGSAPEGMTYYLMSDFGTKDNEGDPTAHTVAGIDHEDGIWLEDGFNEQVETDKGIQAAMDLVRTWSPLQWMGEKGPIESSIGPSIRKAMRKARKFVARLMLPSIHHKIQRARGIMGRVECGEVSVVEGKWGDELIEQCISFPGGRHDDMVDSISLLGRALDKLRPGRQPTPDPAEPDPVKVGSRRHRESSWLREPEEETKNYR